MPICTERVFCAMIPTIIIKIIRQCGIGAYVPANNILFGTEVDRIRYYDEWCYSPLKLGLGYIW